MTKFFFKKIMRAWNSFCASDINDENTVDFNFLVFLIFCFDDEIPDDLRLEQDKKHFEKVNPR